MDNRDWMYTGFASKSLDWVRGTDAFLEHAFGPAAKGSIRMPCPCSKCKNKKKKRKVDMGRDLYKHGFVPNYSRWIFHGEVDRIREDVVRPLLEEYDADAGMADMMADFHDARFNEGLEEEPEETAKAFYEMMEAAQQPLHEKTMVTKLDAISRLIALKSQLSISRDGFDTLLSVIGKLLPEGHILPKNTYESQRLLRGLKMPYEAYHGCPKGCVLFRGDLKEATHCPKCKASRFVEVECSDGRKKQSKIPEMVLRHLPFVPRLQRLYMTEESAKQMTWHKKGKRYNPEKLVHPSDGDAWKHFDNMHPEKAMEARNVRVAFATDGFNPYGWGGPCSSVGAIQSRGLSRYFGENAGIKPKLRLPWQRHSF